MAVAGPAVFAFPDRKEAGRFPVKDVEGQAVAYISASWLRSSFRATDAQGGPLCAGSSGWGGISKTWRATAWNGGPLLTVKTSWTGSRAGFTLERGGGFTLRGSAWKRDFAVTDGRGVAVVSAAPQTSAWSLHPYDYVVQQAEPVLELAELVAVVQIWRMVQQIEATAAAG